MADLTKIATMDYEDTSLQRCVLYKDPDLTAAVALTKGDACYIKTDGTVAKAVSTVDAFHGFAYDTYAVGDRVVLVGPGGKVFYTAASGQTPGELLYISATAGKVSDVAVGSVGAIAFSISDQSFMILAPVGNVS